MKVATDPRERFTTRASSYTKYRPGYPDQLLAVLNRACGFDRGWRVADLGSGTGKLSELFLRHGNAVAGVEPNAAMRSEGEVYLAKYAGFESVAGSAEDTTLADASVDLVAAGQAFHWFDPRAARDECLRILRPPAWTALVWNERDPDGELESAFDGLLRQHAADYSAIMGRHYDSQSIRAFFGGRGFEVHTLDCVQRLDRAGLRGRVESASYCPRPEDPAYSPLMDALDRLFAEHCVDGRVALHYRTRAYVGSLTRG